MSRIWENINQKFAWLKVASVNISYIMVDHVPLFNLSFPFSILQSTYKYKSDCEENVFLVSNKISF